MRPLARTASASGLSAVPALSDHAAVGAAAGYVRDLDAALLMFSEADVWRLRDACEGTLITGGIGSGKSSGSGAALARAYLRAGFGGVVACANVDEAERWRRYCAEEGRSHSLIVMDKSLTQRFNFLEYQMAVGRGSTFEAVQVLLDILSAAEGRIDTAEGGKDAFWQQSMRRMLRATLAPLWAARGRVTLAELMRFIQERPKKPEHLNPDLAEGEAAKRAAEAWFDGSFWAETMGLAEHAAAHPMEKEDFEPIYAYWTGEMIEGDPRTTGNILQTLTARLDPFTSGDLRKLFCTGTTLVPELTFEGAVIVLDLSAHEWGQEGIVAQHIVKTMWQRAMQRRPKTADARPCFLFADECQYFLSPADQAFQSTARACRALTVYLTQNLPGIYAKIGGQRAQDVADALLGNLATQIFHAQPDQRTAQWAAEKIGKALTWRQNISENEGESSGTSSSSSHSTGPTGQGGGNASSGISTNTSSGSGRGASQVIDYRVQPAHFSSLRKGGGPDATTEAIVWQNGRVFSRTGSTFTPVLFKQS
ncbi:type IV secretory system conjugative DNA transfer family protein [Falsiroseomonas sp. CW058]|uniref:type IV secretory system conjugative DNA transfer family protein n=1 Tax=Falsiroseomonas sp. CW058 TaxID=3388664 RepID=UPI003D310AB9